MKMKSLKWFGALAFGCAIAMFTACDDDDNEANGTGEAQFEITDAPIDDPAVKGVFVTIADVKVDGKSLSGFTKTTIDLTAYQEGETKLLGSMQLGAKKYDDVTLVLDLDADASGNAPGCYVLTHDNMKYKLKTTSSGTTEIDIKKDWNVSKDSKTTIVMDFDLRKSIQHSDDASVRYTFVSDSELKSAIRVVEKDNSGSITGTYQEDVNIFADKVIAYVYKKGTFNASSETEVDGENELRFSNAISSTEVKQDLISKTYTIAFLEEGDYEVYFASYKEDQGNENELKFDALLNSEISINGSVGNLIKINSGATITIAAVVKAK